MKPGPLSPIDRAAMHQCCPKEWRQTHDITGSYELDASIERCGNKDLPARLEMYLGGPTHSYGYRTGYSGYSGLAGDD